MCEYASVECVGVGVCVCVFKARALNRPSATKYHAAFAMLQQLQRGDSRARAFNTTKDSHAALRVHFQGDRAGAI